MGKTVVAWVLLNTAAGIGIARWKGYGWRGGGLAALACLVFGPLGWLLGLCGPDTRPRCPFCGAAVAQDARACPRCGQDATPEKVVIACPVCETELDLPRASYGRHVTCPVCERSFLGVISPAA